MPDTPAAPMVKPSNRQPMLYAVTGVVIGVLATLIAIYGTQAFQRYNTPAAAFLRHNKSADASVQQTESGLQFRVLTPAKGAKPTDADVALVMYEGKLTDGTTFDRSEQPTPLKVSGVVPGFSEALKLMPKGAKYRIWLPPALGYGDKASGPIPANAVLQFDVQMIDFLPESVLRQMQMQQMMQQQGAAPGASAAPDASATPGASSASPGATPPPAK